MNEETLNQKDMNFSNIENSIKSTSQVELGYDVSQLLQLLNSQMKMLVQFEMYIGTDQDSKKLRNQINLYSEVSLKLLRRIHELSKEKNFKHIDEYNAILKQFGELSNNIQNKIIKYPDESLEQSSIKSDNTYQLENTLPYENEDELVQILDSFHQDEKNKKIKKITTWGILLGGTLIGAAIGGPIGGYAFYAGAGGLAACLGIGLGGGVLAGVASGSTLVGLKQLQKWTSKTINSIKHKQD